MAYGLGVDLGTTFTAAAVCEPGDRPRMIQLGASGFSIPSVLYLGEDGQFLVGEAANIKAAADPSRVARHFKRRLGDTTPVFLAGTPVDSTALTEQLLAWVLAVVTERLGEPPAHVVLTHPANWGRYRLEILQGIAESAGVEPTSFLSEPEAAAVEYSASERVDDGELIGVYDLGGGTFDAVVMRKGEDRFEIVGRPAGIERLGGVDFDEAILSFVLDAVQYDFDPSDPDVAAAGHALRRNCVDAKLLLSEDTVADVRVALGSSAAVVRMTRGEFEQLIRPLVAQTAHTFRQAMSHAEVEAEELQRILLVGGSSRVPLVGAVLAREFGRPLSIDADPKSTIALGSARVAAGQLDHDPVERTDRPPARLIPKPTFVDLQPEELRDEPEERTAPVVIDLGEAPPEAPKPPPIAATLADVAATPTAHGDAAAGAVGTPPPLPLVGGPGPSPAVTPPPLPVDPAAAAGAAPVSPPPIPGVAEPPGIPRPDPEPSSPPTASTPDPTVTPTSAPPRIEREPAPEERSGGNGSGLAGVASESALRQRLRPPPERLVERTVPEPVPVGADVEPAPSPVNRTVVAAVVVTALVVALAAVLLTGAL